MLNHISIDVTDAKECAVPQDKFRINNYTFTPGAITEDLVPNAAPSLHSLVLRTRHDERRGVAVAYFRELQKQYITFADRKEILLYLGTTQEAYIKSSVAPVEINELKNLLPQAAHWFKFYGNNKEPQIRNL